LILVAGCWLLVPCSLSLVPCALFLLTKFAKPQQLKMKTERVYAILFSSVYPLYIKKVESKGRTKEEVDTVIFWLTGYDKKTLQQQIDKKSDLETFFAQAPHMNPNVSKITGVICGHRVEEIEDKLMQKIRYMDKLVDELAKGKTMEKILRK
jgi:hypothetical protein